MMLQLMFHCDKEGLYWLTLSPGAPASPFSPFIPTPGSPCIGTHEHSARRNTLYTIKPFTNSATYKQQKHAVLPWDQASHAVPEKHWSLWEVSNFFLLILFNESCARNFIFDRHDVNTHHGSRGPRNPLWARRTRWTRLGNHLNLKTIKQMNRKLILSKCNSVMKTAL